MSGGSVLPSNLADLRVYHKETFFPLPAVDYPLGYILLAPLESFPSFPNLITETYLCPGLSVPVPRLLVYFTGIVSRSPADVRPAIY